ncbi:MAG: hypothetical protein GTO40_00160, partial [Deltaproteobacteria bacterium]|nr:hypothetical protein [Deltaproteobacteria bacterium]
SQKIIGILINGQLANAGLTYDDVKKVPTPNVVGGANDFAAGKTDVFFFVFGAGKVKETHAKVGGIRVVSIDPSPEAVARMRQHVGPSYALLVKPSKNILGVHEPVNVMAYDYLMLTHAKAPKEVVYNVVKTMHQNKKGLVAAFQGMRMFSPSRMTKNVPGVQFHAGAIKFYREINQWPPK